MELINIQNLIQSGWCSEGYINMMRKSFTDDEIQIYLSIINQAHTIKSIEELTKYNKEEIIYILKKIYCKVDKDQANYEFNSSNLGWADSTRRIQNKYN